MATIELKFTRILFLQVQVCNVEVFTTQASKTDQPVKIPPKSRTDLSEFEQQQCDLLMRQFKINLNDQKDGLMAIRNSIDASSKMVIKNF